MMTDKVLVTSEQQQQQQPREEKKEEKHRQRGSSSSSSSSHSNSNSNRRRRVDVCNKYYTPSAIITSATKTTQMALALAQLYIILTKNYSMWQQIQYKVMS